MSFWLALCGLQIAVRDLPRVRLVHRARPDSPSMPYPGISRLRVTECDAVSDAG